MARLIDANALLGQVEEKSYLVRSMGKVNGHGMFNHTIEKIINNAPTVDAVEVVRCRNCMHKVDDNEWTGKDGKHYHYVKCDRHRFHLWHTPDDFCSYGERKDNA